MGKKHEYLHIYTCIQCSKQYVAAPERTHKHCPGCLRSNSARQKEEQADSRTASLKLSAMVRDEMAMPWERKWAKSMWERK